MSQAAATSSYPIERRDGEIERLRMQAAALEFDAGVMLERIGVGAGWRCLDLGCGAGGILELLSRRVGEQGRVVGLDRDPVFLEHARALVSGRKNVELVQGDVYRTGLPPASFDLVHVRFVAGTAGRAEELVREAIRLARTGGVVAFEEPDTSTLRCHPPHPAWDRLAQAIDGAFASVGSDVRLGQRLFPLMRHAGLAEVQYRPFFVGFRSCDPMADYLPATVESLRGTILRAGIVGDAELDKLLAEVRRHLADPDTVSTYVTVVQVWGRAP